MEAALVQIDSLPRDFDRKRLARLGQEFGAVLLNTLLGSLQQTMGSVPGSAPGGLSAQYQSFGTEALATALAGVGGIGIGRMIVQSLTKQQRTRIAGAHEK